MRAPRVARLTGAVALIALLACASAAPAQSPLDTTARLGGQFGLAGHVTVAVRVPSEQVGQPLLRTWSFVPLCPVGPCQALALVRQRVTGTDRLGLQLAAANYYVGTGTFYVPLRCHRRVQPRGELVPFRITVQVTNAALGSDGVPIATQIHATYTNRSRTNRTRCVAVPGHDAAVYDGSRVAQ
jgi:hypothetical protein